MSNAFLFLILLAIYSPHRFGLSHIRSGLAFAFVTLTLSAPTSQPSSQPSGQPSSQPSQQPTTQPTVRISSSLKNGLVAYYPFEGNANDKSGNGNNGINVNVVYTTDRLGVANNAASFNGVNSYIRINPGSQFDFGNQISVSFWMRTSSASSWKAILDKSHYNGAYTGSWYVYFGQPAGTLILFDFITPSVTPFFPETGVASFPTSVWCHVAISKSQNSTMYYVNGLLVYSAVTTSKIKPNNLPLYIGAEYGRSQFFQGQLDEIMIFNRSLSSVDVLSLYQFALPTSQPTRQPSTQPSRQPSSQPSQQPTTQPTVRISSSLKNGLVAYYPFEGNANDKSGNGNNGVMRGGVSLVSDRFGNVGSAMSFDGVSGYVEIPGGQFNFANNMSLSMWVKPTSTSSSDWYRLIDKSYYNDSAVAGFVVMSNGTRNGNFIQVCFAYRYQHEYCNVFDHSQSPVHFISNAWNHFVLSRIQNRFSIYLNSVLVSSYTMLFNTVKSNNDLPLILGAANPGLTKPASLVTAFFKGAMDDIFIFDRGLTRNEILALYSFDSPTSQPSSQPTVPPSFQPSSWPSGKPTAHPTSKPSSQPSTQPSSQPISRPTSSPTRQPSSCPSSQPSSHPTKQPSCRPSSQPSEQPTSQPTRKPSCQPSSQPSTHPISQPTFIPTRYPSSCPSCQPSSQPSGQPTNQPSGQPSPLPSRHPISIPTSSPTGQPTHQPSSHPSSHPTYKPSVDPSSQPTVCPSSQPTDQPTEKPSQQPSSRPSNHPSRTPSTQPSTIPSSSPSSNPSRGPSSNPSAQPTTQPSLKLSTQPSTHPSLPPTNQPISHPTVQPSLQPTSRPSTQPSLQPTCQPTIDPTTHPSMQPISCPSSRPTTQPTVKPTTVPSSCPTVNPSLPPSPQPSPCPSVKPFASPTSWPTFPTTHPSSLPTSKPTRVPSMNPTASPTIRPILSPTSFPSKEPSRQPTSIPTDQPNPSPSITPTMQPSPSPSSLPSIKPSRLSTYTPTGLSSSSPSSEPSPSMRSTSQPTAIVSMNACPSAIPTYTPTTLPSLSPTIHPNYRPSDVPTSIPSNQPIARPSSLPYVSPSSSPTTRPSVQPLARPTSQPSSQPLSRPSRQPIADPTSQPSKRPTSQPSQQPTSHPSTSQPTSGPTLASSAPTPVPAPSFSSAPTTTKKPSRSPTMKPTRSPSFSPSVDPTVLPTFSPTVVPTSAPTMTLSVIPSERKFKGSLFLIGQPINAGILNVRNIDLQMKLWSQRSFLVFGQPASSAMFQRPLVLDSRESYGMWSEVLSEGWLSEDAVSRSSIIAADINGDTYEDLIVCYPDSSTCLLYFGSRYGFRNMVVSCAIVGTIGDEFGWSVSTVNDWNQDQLSDFIICAKGGHGVCYLIYGRADFPPQMSVGNITDGLIIIGDKSYFSFGMSVANGNDFNQDGFQDLVVSAMDFSSKSVVYVLLGPLLSSHGNKILEMSLEDPVFQSNILKIYCPTNSFTGFSLAGIGDLNNDGYDDIAIGSLPFRGGYSTQRTYIVFGRPIPTHARNYSVIVDLNELTFGRDGIVIVGAGFLVNAVGDVNQDGISDLMVTSYYNWHSNINAYLVTLPKYVSAPPTFLPSSMPSSTPYTSPTSFPSVDGTPTNQPSIWTPSPTPLFNESSAPSFLMTGRPTKAPLPKKSLNPTLFPSTLIPSFCPSKVPSLIPTGQPYRNTSSPTRQSKPTRLPRTSVPTRLLDTPPPTTDQPVSINTAPFVPVALVEPGEYIGSPGNQQFIVGGPGVYYIDCRPAVMSSSHPSQFDVKLFSLIPLMNEIIVMGFDPRTDIIDLTKYPYLASLEDLTFTTNPLTILLPTEFTKALVNRRLDAIHTTVAAGASASSPIITQQSIVLSNQMSLNVLSSHNFMFFSAHSPVVPPIPSSGLQVLVSFGLMIVGCAFVILLTSLQEIEQEAKEGKKTFNTEYDNLHGNPNISHGEKFLSNYSYSSEEDAWKFSDEDDLEEEDDENDEICDMFFDDHHDSQPFDIHSMNLPEDWESESLVSSLFYSSDGEIDVDCIVRIVNNHNDNSAVP